MLLDGAGIIYLFILILSCYFWAWLTYSHYHYALENDGFHIYRGVLIRKNTVIPYNDIQDIKIYANPVITRLLGLFYLRIITRQVENTAGLLRRASQEQLPGMTPDEVQDLRGKLITASHILPIQPRKFFDPSSGTYH